MNIQGYPLGLGRLIALLVLLAVFVLWLTGHAPTNDVVYGLTAALALALLLP